MNFYWRRPTLVIYRAAEKQRIEFKLNRYPGAVIGATMQIGFKVFSFVWGRPR